MNNPNPFVPKGSILELQSKRRSRLKLAVFCVLAVGVAGLSAMLIQGCKREQGDTTDMTAPTIDTNEMATPDTNPPVLDTNPPVTPVYQPPIIPSNAPVVVPAVEAAGTKYIVVAGDTLGKIARKNGVTLKALEAANPGIMPTKLKINQELTIPAATPNTMAPASSGMDSTSAMGEIYTVKNGDTLTRIARHYGTSVKAIQSANGLTTTRIKVGQKLKIPGKGEAAVPASEPAATSTPAAVAPAPVPPPDTTPAQ
jgi:LysM repeat protein